MQADHAKHPNHSCVSYWGEDFAIHPEVFHMVMTEASMFFSIDELLQEWGKLAYLKGHVPRMASSEKCSAWVP
eukprot:3152814-Alexandrium_andersonii.AAC.1